MYTLEFLSSLYKVYMKYKYIFIVSYLQKNTGVPGKVESKDSSSPKRKIVGYIKGMFAFFIIKLSDFNIHQIVMHL